MTSSLPNYPWQVVGTDFFELDKKYYLVVVDYFSCYPEVVKMSFNTSACSVAVLKNIFAWHGIPKIVRSDNGLSTALINLQLLQELIIFST